MTTWPAGLTRSPITSLLNKSNQDHRFAAILAENTQESSVLELPFHAQTQSQTNWCWSAVATSVGLFYGTGNWTQCAVATQQVNTLVNPGGTTDCCVAPSTCNVYGVLYFSLQYVDALDHWADGRALPSTLYDRIVSNRELVCLRILWDGSNTAAHFTTIKGCTVPSDHGSFIISTSDSLEGFSGTTMPYADFPEHYHGGGKWTDTFLTRSRFGKPVKFGSFNRPFADLNDNGWCLIAGVDNGGLSYTVGKVEFSDKTITWGNEEAFGSGTFGGMSLGYDNICVAAYTNSSKLCFKMGQLDVHLSTINWQQEKQYGDGDSNSIVLLDHNVCVEAHIFAGQIYTATGWLLGNGNIAFDAAQALAPGTKASVAAAGEACIAIHASEERTGTIYYNIGTLDLFHSKVKWGPICTFGPGEIGDVSMNTDGLIMVSYLKNGSVFLQSGQLGKDRTGVDWNPAIEISAGSTSSLSLDSLGRFIEVHAIGADVFYSIGRN